MINFRFVIIFAFRCAGSYNKTDRTPIFHEILQTVGIHSIPVLPGLG